MANIEFDVRSSGYALRPADPADGKACRMLLPHMTGQASFIVAVDALHGLVVGAAAATFSRRRKPLVGPGVGVHVVAPCRGLGVGRALVAALLQYAERCGDDAVYSAQRVAADGEEFAAWKGMGFHAAETVEEHELALEALEPRLAPLVEWLQANQRVPRDARIVPLYAADRQAVLDLHLAHLGGDRDDLLNRLQGRGSGAFHPRYSRVLTVGENVAGCLLAHRADRRTATVDAVVVAPELRDGWASVWLKLEACRGARSIGIERFLFKSFDRYEDTRRFAARLGGVTTRTWALMTRPVIRRQDA